MADGDNTARVTPASQVFGGDPQPKIPRTIPASAVWASSGPQKPSLMQSVEQASGDVLEGKSMLNMSELDSTTSSAVQATAEKVFQGKDWKQAFDQHQKEAQIRKANPTADPNFNNKIKQAATDSLQARFQHPVDEAIGELKGGVSAIRDSVEMVGDGLAALIQNTTGYQPAADRIHSEAAQRGDDLGIRTLSGIDDRVKQREMARQQATQFSTAFSRMNLAPSSKAEEAAGQLLALIPEGQKYIGDDVFDNTGSALAGAGAQVLPSLMGLKSESAAKLMKQAKRGWDYTRGRGEPGAPPPVDNVGPVFDELTLRDPSAAQALLTHVGDADPQLKTALLERTKAAAKKSPTEIALASAEANIRARTGTAISGKQTYIPGQLPKAPTVKPSLGAGAEDAELGGSTSPQAPRLRAPDTSLNPKTSGPAALPGAQSEIQTAQTRPQSSQETPKAQPKISNETAQAAVHTYAAEAAEALVDDPTVDVPLDIPTEADVKLGDLVPVKETRDQALSRMVRSKEVDPWEEASPADTGQKGVDVGAGLPLRALGKLAADKMGLVYGEFLKLVNPEATSYGAKVTGNLAAQGFYRLNRADHFYNEKVKQDRLKWFKLGDQAGKQFYLDFEAGRRQPDKWRQDQADMITRWGAKIEAQDRRNGVNYTAVNHYLPRIYKDPQKVTAYFNSRYGDKWTKPGFMKARKFTLLQEALRQGFELKSYNPMTNMALRQHSSDVAQMRVQLLDEMNQIGLAKESKQGDPVPMNYEEELWRAPNGKAYLIHKRAWPIIKNAFDNKGLWEREDAFGRAYRGVADIKNKLVGITLAWPAFHVLHVASIDAIANFTRNAQLMMDKPGSFAKAISGVAAIHGSLWSNPHFGHPILQVFQGKGDYNKLTPIQKQTMRYMAEAGAIPTRPQEEMLNSWSQFQETVAKMQAPGGRTALNGAKAGWHLATAGLSLAGRPFFEHWIPSLKIASFAQDASAFFERKPLIAQDARLRALALRQIWRRIETRYGEMNYQTMFLNRVVKDVGTLSMLSMGWNYGLVEQHAGGIIDAGRVLGGKGKGPKDKHEDYTSRPIMYAAYMAFGALVAAAITYAFTGEYPQTWEDFTHPRTGKIGQDGKPERLNLMLFTREYGAFIKHGLQKGWEAGALEFMEDKGSGVVGKAITGITGVNAMGQHITNEDDPVLTRLGQDLSYLFKDSEPIIAQIVGNATGNAGKKETDWQSIGLGLAGMGPAGKYMSQSTIEGKIGDYYDRFVRPKETSYDKTHRAKETKDLQAMYASSDPGYKAAMGAYAKENRMTGADVAKREREFRNDKNFDFHVYAFEKLEFEQQKKLLDQMTNEERKRFLPHAAKKLRQSYRAPEESV